MRVYPYRIGQLNIRALLDKHSHCIHVAVLARHHQKAVLPSQPATARRSGTAAVTQATVHAWVHARVPTHYG